MKHIHAMVLLTGLLALQTCQAAGTTQPVPLDESDATQQCVSDRLPGSLPHWLNGASPDGGDASLASWAEAEKDALPDELKQLLSISSRKALKRHGMGPDPNSDLNRAHDLFIEAFRETATERFGLDACVNAAAASDFLYAQIVGRLDRDLGARKVDFSNTKHGEIFSGNLVLFWLGFSLSEGGVPLKSLLDRYQPAVGTGRIFSEQKH